MALSTFVKISNISNLSDARYCAGMGVNQLGFNFNPNDTDHITPELFNEIKGWIAGVEFVGEFGDMSVDDIKNMQQDLPLDMIELSVIDHVEQVHLLGKKLSFRLPVDHHVHLQDFSSTLSYLDELVDQVVIEGSSPQLYDEINTEVNFYNGRLKLIKGFNLKVESLNLLGNYHGIQIAGTPELEPGNKDYGEVMDILEALEVD